MEIVIGLFVVCVFGYEVFDRWCSLQEDIARYKKERDSDGHR